MTERKDVEILDALQVYYEDIEEKLQREEDQLLTKLEKELLYG